MCACHAARLVREVHIHPVGWEADVTSHYLHERKRGVDGAKPDLIANLDSAGCTLLCVQGSARVG